MARSPPAQAQAQGDWALGAGVGIFGDSTTGFVVASPGFASISATTPSYSLSLERRLGETTWLGVNGGLSYSRSDQPVTSTVVTTDPNAPPTRDTLSLVTSRESVLVGVRQIVARSVVDVSLFASIGFGHAAFGGDDPRAGEQVLSVPGTTANAVAFVGGLAIERALIDALAVRLIADIGQVSYTAQHTVTLASTGSRKEIDTATIAASLGLRMALQLEFYF